MRHNHRPTWSDMATKGLKPLYTPRRPAVKYLGIKTYDNVLNEKAQRAVLDFLRAPTWLWGWRSNESIDQFMFWHKHFAGFKHEVDEPHPPSDVSDQLAPNKLLSGMWQYINQKFLPGYLLTRCYANGLQYGSDGTLHDDSEHAGNVTAIYYPHLHWHPNWGGETVFVNDDEDDIVAVTYPKPNRMVIFDGRMPHVARGVSRICPELRITLMFKAWKQPNVS